MQETINRLLYLNGFHWGGSAYQWFFYISIVLVFLFENRKMVRVVFGVFPIVYLACIFNPFTLKLLEIADLANDAYFVRLFSFMPLMYVIARGFCFLLRYLRRLRNEWAMLIGVSSVCAVICLTGHNIYDEDWFRKAENLAKVPQDTLEIVEAIKENDHPNIAAIDESTVYLRQVADVMMPYGRGMGEWGNQLSMDPPDVQYVMEQAGQQDVDYVVAHGTQVTRSMFLEHGYLPYALTQNYAIYKVDKVPRIKRVFTTDRKVASRSFYNAEGELTTAVKGYCTEIYTYNANGQTVAISYLDENGQPFLVDGIYSTLKLDHYRNGKVKSLFYLNENMLPVLYKGFYEIRFKYDIAGRIIRTSYYNAGGEPMISLDKLCASIDKEYDANGRVVRERYLDTDGRLVNSKFGCAMVLWEYDGEKMISESYCDTNGQIVSGEGAAIPSRASCMDMYYQNTDGASREGEKITFESLVEGNAFNAVRFQIYDPVTGENLANFGDAFRQTETSGMFTSDFPSGLYTLVFKGNTNMKDEFISCAIYLNPGDALRYHYRIDELRDEFVEVSDFHIERLH